MLYAHLQHHNDTIIKTDAMTKTDAVINAEGKLL